MSYELPELATSDLLKTLNASIQTKLGRFFKDVTIYGGEFGVDDVPRLSFDCPAALSTCVGWRKKAVGSYLSGFDVWEVRVAVFVVTKGAKREQRLQDAMDRAELISRLTRDWRGEGCLGKPEGQVAENLHSPKLDKAGLALWMVAWWQEAAFPHRLPLPELPELDEIDIDSSASPVATEAAPPVLPDLVVEHEVRMKNDETQ